MIAVCVFLSVGSLCGCTWTDGGVRKSLVIGIGIVETSPAPTVEVGESTRISNVRMLGVFFGETPAFSGFLAGYAQSQRVEVPVNAEALIEATTYDDGSLHVKVQPIVIDSNGGNGQGTEGDD